MWGSRLACGTAALFAAVALAAASAGGAAARSSRPATKARGGPARGPKPRKAEEQKRSPVTFEDLLGRAVLLPDVASLIEHYFGVCRDGAGPDLAACSRKLKKVVARGKDDLFALNLPRVECEVVPDSWEIAVVLPGLLRVPPYGESLLPEWKERVIGPFVSTGRPVEILPPDFARGRLSYSMANPSIALFVLALGSRDRAALWERRYGGHLRAHLVVRVVEVWRRSYSDPFRREEISLSEAGVRTPLVRKGGRYDVIGLRVEAVGHRVYDGKSGELLFSSPVSLTTRLAALAPPEAPLIVGPEGAFGAGPAGPASAGVPESAAARAARIRCAEAVGRREYAAAEEACAEALRADPLDEEARRLRGAIPRTPSEDAVRRHLARSVPAARRCALLGKERVRVLFTVRPEGKIAEVEVPKPLRGKPLGRCLRRVVEESAFPPFLGEPVRTSFLFDLTEDL